jgi:vancomycin permeability regulator SanA
MGAGIIDAVARWWAIPDNPPTDPGCLVVPTYAVVDRTRPTRPTRAQIELALAWWRRYPQAVVIMSTGDNQRLGVSNASVMADYAVALGLPRSQIIEEDRSMTTFENLHYSMETIRREGLGQPTLVTLDLYTRRAVATARKLGWSDFHWLSVYAEGEPAYGWKRVQTRSRATILAYEMGAMVFSRLKGWV